MTIDPTDLAKHGLGRSDAFDFGPTVDMLLYCPKCGLQHVDKPEPGLRISGGPNAGRVEGGWTNPPHRSHLCHGCGHIWRPSDVNRNGVLSIRSEGVADSPFVKAVLATLPAIQATPYAYAVVIPGVRSELVHDLDEAIDDLTDCERVVRPLYDHPPPAAQVAMPAMLYGHLIRALTDVLIERSKRDAQWGGAGHDDEHTTGEFLSFVLRQHNKACPESDDGRRARFIKIAALAIAAVESIDRKANELKGDAA